MIIDARRMCGVPDVAIEREARKWARELMALRHLILVDHYGNVLDIK